MAVSENTGGSQSASVGTEHTLATLTSAGTYQLGVNTENMINGDKLELRIYVKLRSASSSRLAFFGRYAHRQGDAGTASAAGAVIKFSPPVPAPFEFKATLKQTDGSGGRTFDWSVYQY